jgi:hypothetical protein
VIQANCGNSDTLATMVLSRHLFLVTLLTATVGSAQTYPVKPIRVVTAEPGGGNDFAARTIGQAIGSRLGQPWVIDSRGGAGGVIAIETAARAPTDGYTLLVYAQNVRLQQRLKNRREGRCQTWIAVTTSLICARLRRAACPEASSEYVDKDTEDQISLEENGGLASVEFPRA